MSAVAAALSAAHLRAPNAATYDQAVAVAGAGGRCARQRARHADGPVWRLRVRPAGGEHRRAPPVLVQRRSDGFVMASVIGRRSINMAGFWPGPFVPLFPEVLAHLPLR